jgi:tetratricopeptide (TPR) repeat protein
MRYHLMLFREGHPTMLRKLIAREATDVGTSLADGVVLHAGPAASTSNAARRERLRHEQQRFMQRFLQQVDRDARPLKLNVFSRAKLANAFKWRLLEKGADSALVEELTQALVLQLTANRSGSAAAATASTSRGRAAGKVQELLARGDACVAGGSYGEAIECYQQLLSIDPRHAVAHNNLGAAYSKLGRYRQAEEEFRRAIALRDSYADAHCNLGTTLRWRGRTGNSEAPLRRALKLKPTHTDAQVSLSTTLLLGGRLAEAKNLLDNALRLAPRNVPALVAMGQVAGAEGRFGEADSLFRRALEADPRFQGAWAALVWLRRMTAADGAWLRHAEAIADGGLPPLHEANIRYAIGKYYDDIGDFGRAFRSYRRANDLQKVAADPYDREARTRFVDDLIRVYTRETLARASRGAADSMRPVFVVGMPRTGTSLVEQIIASHPAASGAGELGFWSEAMRKHEKAIRSEPIGESLRKKLSSGYLRVLGEYRADALRIVDKATFNSEYLGVIHSVFPNARMIYVRRQPIDTCLACYFQQFSQDMNFMMDLSDLAHYYRQHHRIVAHWRSVLPPGVLLDVPYEELVADPQAWTRRIVDFIGLPWDEKCLNFHETQRTVLTASFWQVRQRIYDRSVGRSRNYRKYLDPLLGLRDLE